MQRHIPPLKVLASKNASRREQRHFWSPELYFQVFSRETNITVSLRSSLGHLVKLSPSLRVPDPISQENKE